MKYNDKVGRANSAKWSEELRDQAVREYEQEQARMNDQEWDLAWARMDQDLIRPENN